MTDRLTCDRYVNPYTDFGFKMLFGTEMNKERYEEYEDSLKAYRDWENTIETAMVKSHAEGKAEGRAEERMEIA